jgi:hypothetical protein
VPAARVGVPVTSAKAATGNARANAITAIAIVEIRLGFIFSSDPVFQTASEYTRKAAFYLRSQAGCQAGGNSSSGQECENKRKQAG